MRIFLALCLILVAVPSYSEYYLLVKTSLIRWSDGNIREVATDTNGTFHKTLQSCEQNLTDFVRNCHVLKKGSWGMYVDNLQCIYKDNDDKTMEFFSCVKIFNSDLPK